MAFAYNAQFTEDEFEHFRHISGLKREQKNIVLVVSPLLNPMKNQGSRLNSRGTSAISFSDVSSELEIRAGLFKARLS